MARVWDTGVGFNACGVCGCWVSDLGVGSGGENLGLKVQ